MANEVNLSSIRAHADSAISTINTDYIDSLNNNFLEFVLGFYSPSHGMTLKEDIAITVNELTNVASKLDSSLSFIDNLSLPERPPEIDIPIERDKDHVYIDSTLDNIQEAFSNFYSGLETNSITFFNEGSPLDAIQEAEYNYGYKKSLMDTEVKVDDIAIKWSADGYEKAPGAMSFDINQVVANFMDSQNEKTKDVAYNLVRQIDMNIRHAFQQGISIEKMHMEFSKRYTEYRYQELNTIISAYVGQIEKVIKEIEGPDNIINTTLEAVMADVDNEKRLSALELSQALAESSAYVSARGASISAEQSRTDSKIKLLENALKGYTDLFATYGSLFTGVLIQEQSAQEEGA